MKTTKKLFEFCEKTNQIKSTIRQIVTNMRFYPTTDVNFFYDIPPIWNRYCSSSPKKTWKRLPQLEPLHVMFVYRDLEGASMKKVHQKDLYFPGEWQKTRIRYEACLPIHYGVGNRFIRLERGPPLGFKCSPMPINVQDMRALNDYFRKIVKEEARLQKLQEKVDGASDKESKKKKRKK